MYNIQHMQHIYSILDQLWIQWEFSIGKTSAQVLPLFMDDLGVHQCDGLWKETVHKSGCFGVQCQNKA